MESTHTPIWETKLPFEMEHGDGALIAKAMRAYRPENAEEEAIVNFFIEQFDKLDQSAEPTETQQGLIPIPDGYAEQ